jgi:LysM repeat protein
LGKAITGTPPRGSRKPASPSTDNPSDKPAPGPTDKVSDKGFEYVIQDGDYPAKIVKAYAAKNIKVTVKQILDANPGLNPNKMIIGQKIFIPAPQ